MCKNILLSGCSKGVGLETAKELLSQGYTIYGISRTITKDLDELIIQNSEKFNHLKFDLNDIKNIKENIFNKFLPNRIPIHAFINNAAHAYDDIITNLNFESLRYMFEVNVFSPMLITKNVIRNMLFNNVPGSIIHISSISVHTAYKGLAMYASSKGALEAFSKGTAREWGERGIRSNCIVAGFMETDMSNSLSIEQKDRIYKRTALKKATDIQSVASTIAYLISDKANSITGQNIFVDSGTI